MSFNSNLMAQLDQALSDLWGQWDIYSSTLAAILLTVIVYFVYSSSDADTHPLLLARQAQASAVRLPGESAVYRSQSTSHGESLLSGLNIRDPGDSRWVRGRDGDLKDVWRRVLSGDLDRDGNPIGVSGSILTVLGTEHAKKHELKDVTQQINLIGQRLKQGGSKKVAIYLPNSIEFLAALFACAFYDLTAILVPYNSIDEGITSLLQKSNADSIIAPAGSISLDTLTKNVTALQHIVWVVDEGSTHMDWNEVPRGTGEAINVSTWQEIVQEQDSTAGLELPAIERSTEVKGVIGFWSTGEMVQYTQANLVAAIAGQLTSIVNDQRITNADVVLPADSLTTIYTLVLTLTALYSHATVALNSVAGGELDIVTVTHGIAPTVLIVSSTTLSKTHRETAARMSSPIYRLVHWSHTRSLVQNGVMPVASIASRLFDNLRPVVGTTPGKLRLIFTSASAGQEETYLSAETLSDLRIYLGSRIVYALTAPKIAGPITQTNLYDYRVDGQKGSYSHFGAPVTSVEVFCKDTKHHRTTDSVPAGEIFVRGPAVVGGQASVGASGKILEDHTLALL